MIGKKVTVNQERAARKTKAANIRDLTDYITAPGADEKVLYENARHFLYEDLPHQQTEMIELAERASRSAHPVSHYILSWREGEQPTPEQAEEAVTVLLEELGLPEHQAIYALHRDTDNVHLHLAVNRVHPDTARLVRPNNNFDIEAVHKALARIEHEQGWQPERNARYTVLADGSVARNREVAESRPQPGQRARDFEQRTGTRSAERIALEDFAPTLREASSWQELHERLAAAGVRLAPKGSGGLLWIGEQPVKLSLIGRDASFGALQKRLGPYEPPEDGQQGRDHVRRPGADHQHLGGADGGERAKPSQPGATRAAEEPPPRPSSGLRGVPAGRVAADRHEPPVLLPGHVPPVVVEGRAHGDPGLRRDQPRAGRRVGEGIQLALPVLRSARSWEDLHDRLGELGLRYERKGSGAVLRIDEHVVKASVAHRSVTLAALEKRLGPFRSAPEAGAPPAKGRPGPARSPTPLESSPVQWKEYAAARSAHYDTKNVALLELRKRHDAEREALREAQRARREALLPSIRDKTARQAMRSLLAAEQAGERATARDRMKGERHELYTLHPRFPDLEQWLRERDPAEAGRWRYRSSAPGRLEGPAHDPPVPRDIRAFVASVHGAEVHYHRERPDNAYSFIDRGRAIHVHETHDRTAVLASMQLAAQKWGRFKVAGDDRYKALSVELAAEHGFQLDNPELQAELKERRATRFGFRRSPTAAAPPDTRPPVPSIGSAPPPECRATLRTIARDFHAPGAVAWPRTAPGAPASPAGPQHQPEGQGRGEAMARNKPHVEAEFDRYHAAVGAERYRVTSIRMSADGSKKVLIVDKQDGVTRGFTPEELRARTRELLRLEARGENLYYTPLSEKRHHILVDDMNREGLTRLVQAGFKPAVVIESSPGNYQAVLTVQKLGTPHDRDIGNRLSLYLNREFGDPNLSGAVHPHRAPGYSNRKPERRNENGSFPLVRLLQAEARECDVGLAMSRTLLAEREAEAARGRQRASRAPRPLPAATTATTAYYEHHRDIASRFHNGDQSRMDAMIAVRLRATGHDEAAVIAALATGAPTIRPPEKAASHQWQDYAARTASYAFGPGGDRELARTERYHTQWRQLESAPPRSPPAPQKPVAGPESPGI